MCFLLQRFAVNEKPFKSEHLQQDKLQFYTHMNTVGKFPEMLIKKNIPPDLELNVKYEPL